jgi:hypothetical protein
MLPARVNRCKFLLGMQAGPCFRAILPDPQLGRLADKVARAVGVLQLK